MRLILIADTVITTLEVINAQPREEIMSVQSENAGEVLRSIWQQNSEQLVELDEECNPNKVCRNMKEVSFEGFGDEGSDVASAWKAKLAREGKLNTGNTIADLVFGQQN
jgi:hypothetical protein